MGTLKRYHTDGLDFTALPTLPSRSLLAVLLLPTHSLFNSRAAMEAANLFDAKGRCKSPFGNMRAIMSCPKGTVVDSNNGLKKRCQDNHLTCPTGYPCFCGMCVANKYATIYPGEVVLGLSTALFGMNLAVIVFWGFGLEIANCLRGPMRKLVKKVQSAMRRRSVPQHRASG
mmetsp:Transcript_30286/g.80200  ORF Transcript_30286/g.80200 Transcript_30286/m.80200 type:complete len:172 (-) Transcript_30286:61-576(-)